MTNTFIICNNEDEIKSNKSCWGNQTFEISAQDIAALLEGKTLTAMVNDEYGIFIKIEADSIVEGICDVLDEQDEAWREQED